jgi:hypothetical protein
MNVTTLGKRLSLTEGSIREVDRDEWASADVIKVVPISSGSRQGMAKTS